MDAAGQDIRLLPAIGVVAETSCRFLASLSFPDLVTAGLGHFVHVYVDRATRQPVPVPQVIRDALDELRPGVGRRPPEDVGGGSVASATVQERW